MVSTFNPFPFKSNKCLLPNSKIKVIASWFDLDIVIVNSHIGGW